MNGPPLVQKGRRYLSTPRPAETWEHKTGPHAPARNIVQQIGTQRTKGKRQRHCHWPDRRTRRICTCHLQVLKAWLQHRMYVHMRMPALAGCGGAVDRPQQTSGFLRRGERQCPGRIAIVVGGGMRCRDPAASRTSSTNARPPAALGTCIRAQTACCAACHGSIPLDNGPVWGLASYIVGPRAHAAAGEWGSRPRQRIRRFESTRDHRTEISGGREPHPLGPGVCVQARRQGGSRSQRPDHLHP